MSVDVGIGNAIKRKISPRDLHNKIRDAVITASTRALSDTEKFDHVLDAVTEWVDARLTWEWTGPLSGLFENLDGKVIRKLLAVAVEQVYQGMKRAGEV